MNSSAWLTYIDHRRLLPFVFALLATSPASLDAQPLDLAWNPSANDVVHAAAFQSHDRLLVGGTFSRIGDVASYGLARLNPNGSLDLSFNSDRSVFALALAVLPDDRILVAGAFNTTDGISASFHIGIGRLLPDGKVDPGFRSATVSGAYSYIDCLVVQSDGKVLIGGSFTAVNDVARAGIARLNPDGTLDTSFAPAVSEPLNSTIMVGALAVQADGRILFAGDFTTVDGQSRIGIARLETDGTLDSDFRPRVLGSSDTLAVQPDGKILIGGGFVSVNGTRRNGLARLNIDGELDADFAAFDASAFVRAIVVRPSGKILVGGLALPGSDQPEQLVLLRSDGARQEDFLADMKGSTGQSPSGVYQLVTGPDGRTVIAGNFTSLFGQARSCLARIGPARPIVGIQSMNLVTSPGASNSLYVGAITDVPPVYTWTHDGRPIAGATQPNLALTSAQPSHAGFYSATITTELSASSRPILVGMSTRERLVGAGLEVASDVQHVNGNRYDQILLYGSSASMRADAGQVLRVSFIDLTDDIVQVEMSGAGTLTVALEAAKGPEESNRYVQPGVAYMRGHARVLIADADETTNLSIFTVGRANAGNPTLFRPDIAYDGVADIAYVAIQSRTGRFGSLRTANTSFSATQGVTGVYAPGINFAGVVSVGDIGAFDQAAPVLLLGATHFALLTGGDLFQPNARPIQVSGFNRLLFTDGSTSHGTLLPAQINRGRLENDGIDVTDTLVMNP